MWHARRLLVLPARACLLARGRESVSTQPASLPQCPVTVFWGTPDDRALSLGIHFTVNKVALLIRAVWSVASGPTTHSEQGAAHAQHESDREVPMDRRRARTTVRGSRFARVPAAWQGRTGGPDEENNCSVAVRLATPSTYRFWRAPQTCRSSYASRALVGDHRRPRRGRPLGRTFTCSSTPLAEESHGHEEERTSQIDSGVADGLPDGRLPATRSRHSSPCSRRNAKAGCVGA